MPRVPRAHRAAVAAMDLSLRIGERLLAGGQGAADVEAVMLAVLRSYAVADCEPQITFTMISVSRQAGPHGIPTTVGRTVRHRAPDYSALMALYRLIGQITEEGLDIRRAEARLGRIEARPGPYPPWVLHLAPGLLAASASLLVSARSDVKAWVTFAVALGAAVAGGRLAAALSTLGLQDFYLTAAAAMPASAAGVAMGLAGAGLGGSAVVTGSLFALFPGRTLLGAVEDGLTGFYLTAAARLLEVVYLVAAIVLGVLAILPFGVRLGAQFAPEQGFERGFSPGVQLPAAAALGVSLAVLTRTPRRLLPTLALGGMLAWGVFDVLSGPAGLNPVAATGFGACAAALFGQFAARFRHFSPLPYITGSLCPLLPGSLLYTGVLYLGQGKVVDGVGDLSLAAATALALAVGVGIATEAVRIARGAGSSARPARFSGGAVSNRRRERWRRRARR